MEGEYTLKKPTGARGGLLCVGAAVQAVQARPEGSAPVGRRTGLTRKAEPEKGADGDGTGEPDQDMQDAPDWEEEMRETATDSFIRSGLEAATLEEGEDGRGDMEGARVVCTAWLPAS
jgi:hypothetical protein